MSGIKSKAALIYNIRLLAAGSDKVRFWTFTLPGVVHPTDAAAMWGNLNRELRRSLGFRGVRVFELHPGGHGLHVHVLTPDYYPIEQVLEIVRRMGWGRVGVELWDENDPEQAQIYMSKYLTKQVKTWRGCSLKGIRWWATFGKVSDKVRVADCTIESPRRRIWDSLPAWFVCAAMGVSAEFSTGLKKKPMTVKEKEALEVAKAYFKRLYDNRGRAKIDFKGSLRFSPTRCFNWSKMWLVNRIYAFDSKVMEAFDGTQKACMGFNLGYLREVAFQTPCVALPF